jgi:hypothetical protein
VLIPHGAAAAVAPDDDARDDARDDAAPATSTADPNTSPDRTAIVSRLART